MRQNHRWKASFAHHFDGIEGDILGGISTQCVSLAFTGLKVPKFLTQPQPLITDGTSLTETKHEKFQVE